MKSLSWISYSPVCVSVSIFLIFSICQWSFPRDQLRCRAWNGRGKLVWRGTLTHTVMPALGGITVWRVMWTWGVTSNLRLSESRSLLSPLLPKVKPMWRGKSTGWAGKHRPKLVSWTLLVCEKGKWDLGGCKWCLFYVTLLDVFWATDRHQLAFLFWKLYGTLTEKVA